MGEADVKGRMGAERYRAWMREVGIMDKIALETRAVEIGLDGGTGVIDGTEPHPSSNNASAARAIALTSIPQR